VSADTTGSSGSPGPDLVHLAKTLSALYLMEAEETRPFDTRLFATPKYYFAFSLEEVITMFDRITFDSQIMGGRACIRGMRIPVSVIVGQIAHGATFEEILEGYPDLEREDIQQAIEYAAWLTQEEVHLR
jgi:uncharacterized protein (DUF433 family)